MPREIVFEGFVPNKAGYRALFKSPGVEGVMAETAEGIAADVNAEGHGRFGSRTKIQSVSAHAYVFTADQHAMYAERKYDLLNKHLGG